MSRLLKDRSQRTVGCAAIIVLLMAALMRPVFAADPVVSAISKNPSGDIHHGRIVFADLVTTDPQAAVAFYVAVFGWTATNFDEDYIELRHNGRFVSSVVRFEDGEAGDGDARWLVSISVNDVDSATSDAVAAGGEILEQPIDLPDRGRYSVIADSQGAVVMLLRATGGDPVDDGPTINEWDWAELWTDDAEVASTFYEAAFGYAANRYGEDRIVLGTENRARAIIVATPWADVQPNWMPYMPVADVADTVQKVETAGGAVLLQSDRSEESPVAILVDPTGGVFAIQQLSSEQ